MSWTPLNNAGKPNLLLGVSAYTSPITSEKESSLITTFEEPNMQKCQCCGASITLKMRKSLYAASRWWNACPMCFYTENIDLIPDHDKGHLMYMPEVSQIRLNSMLRCFWAVTYFYSIEPDNMVLREMNNTVTQEINNLTSINQKSAQVHYSLADPEILASMFYLIPREDYEKRYKLLSGIRWYPKKSLFSEEIDFWSRNDHSSLSPKEINGNISKFMARYMDSNFAVRDAG